MNRKYAKTLRAAFIVVALPGVATSAELRTAKFPLAERYIVVLKGEAARKPGERSARPDVITVAIDLSAKHDLEPDRIYEYALQGFSVRASRKSIQGLLSDPRVDYVEEDGLAFADTTQSNATWGLDRIDQRNLPLSTTYEYVTTASNVHAYVIDSGIRASHSDFGGRVSGGLAAIDDGRGTNDCHGHGTHVAGTLGGATWGVAKAVRLHPVRVLNCEGSGTNSEVIRGIRDIHFIS